MKAKDILTIAAIALAIVGGIVLVSGIFLSSYSYRGFQAEPYSFINHFISELDWSKVTPSASTFNWALVISNLFFFPLLYALGRYIGTPLGYTAMLSGMFMLIAGISVGLLPLDDMRSHLIASMIFFGLYSTTMLLFTIVFVPRWNKNPSIPMVIAGIACCSIAITFLILPKDSIALAVQDFSGFQRPQIWHLAILEWLIPVSACLWCSTAISLLYRHKFRHGRKNYDHL